MSDRDFYKIIENKIIDYVEVVVLFFEHCNMKCVFCPQNHDDTTGANREDIVNKAQLVVDYINTSSKQQFVIHIMGGELFQDHWITQGFIEVYQEFVDTVKHNVTSGKTVDFLFVTNLVYEQIDAVLDFCNRNQLTMNVSYDPAGRFNAQELALFKRNIQKFQPYVHLISTVITRQNIEKIIAGDAYYDYLYQTFETDWDQLLPGKNFNPALMPRESQLLEYYRFMIDRYPRCNNIAYFLNKNTQKKMSCTRGSSHTIMTDGSSPKGCSGTVLLKDPRSEELGSSKIIQIFLEEKDCLSCEFYSRCSFTCFIKNEYKHLIRDVDGCVFAEAFRYADAKTT